MAIRRAMTGRFPRSGLAASFVACWFSVVAVLGAAAQDGSPMASTMAEVAAKWPNLTHAPTAHVADLMATGQAVLFDVRSAQEYAVSHIPGAQHVDPAMGREAFMAAHGAALKGKVPVFYCAVGVRSSKLADRIGTQALIAAGAARALSMSGGVFQWHWESRPLVSDQGPTDLVHGYDANWGRLVKPR